MKPSDRAFIETHGGCADDELLQRYAARISPHLQSLIKGDVSSDPIARQYIPQKLELDTTPEELADPIGDDVHSPVKGIVHRYPDRVLFKPVHVCPVYCRYCFRREMVGPKASGPAEILSNAERVDALDYIAVNPEIFEVIITGGDPFIMSPAQIREIVWALNLMDHVRVVRFHTRVAVADPERIVEDLCAALAGFKGVVYVVLHINHAQEIDGKAHVAIKALRASGAVLLSQSVLLRGVNDNAAALEDLFRELVALGVKPYYLHHPDMAPGTSHFRVSIEEGQNLMRALQGRLSGLCLPTYMLDIPGGYGKVPLTPTYIERDAAGAYRVTDRHGKVHKYG